MNAVESETIVVFITAPEGEIGAKIARDLVEKRLAACVNIINGVRSVYRWQGEIQDDAEQLLVVKTVRERFEALRQRVLQIHPYTVPEVIALPVIAGSESYLAWVAQETSEAK